MMDHAAKIAILILALLCTPAMAEIYKVVDENGNITFTDRPPGPEYKPVELKGLSVISPQQAPKGRDRDEGDQAEEEPELSIRELRRSYKNFAITSPKQDESLWETNNTATVAWATGYQMQASMSVVVYLDGQAQPPTNAPVAVFENLDRGAHSVRAELFDGKNRRVASTPSVTFYIKQQSINFPNNLNNPNNPNNPNNRRNNGGNQGS